MWLSILWTNFWVIYERTLNEWLRIYSEQILNESVKETKGFFKEWLRGFFLNKLPELILNLISICPLGFF